MFTILDHQLPESDENKALGKRLQAFIQQLHPDNPILSAIRDIKRAGADELETLLAAAATGDVIAIETILFYIEQSVESLTQSVTTFGEESISLAAGEIIPAVMMDIGAAAMDAAALSLRALQMDVPDNIAKQSQDIMKLYISENKALYAAILQAVSDLDYTPLIEYGKALSYKKEVISYQLEAVILLQSHLAQIEREQKPLRFLKDTRAVRKTSLQEAITSIAGMDTAEDITEELSRLTNLLQKSMPKELVTTIQDLLKKAPISTGDVGTLPRNTGV